MKSCLFFSFLIFGLNAGAAVTTKKLSNSEIRMSFSGNDIEKFSRLEKVFEKSGSSIRSKCFQDRIQDEFGDLRNIFKCAFIFKNNENTKFGKTEHQIVQFTESEVIATLRKEIENNKSVVGKVNEIRKKRQCSFTNSNPNCRQVLSGVKLYTTLMK